MSKRRRRNGGVVKDVINACREEGDTDLRSVRERAIIAILSHAKTK